MPILVRRRRRIVFKPKDSRQCKHDHAHSKSPWISPHQDPRKSKTGSKSSIQDWTMSQESRSDEIRERKDDHHKSLVDNTPHGSFTGGDDDSVLGHDELNVAIPSLFTSVPLIRDSLETKSTVLQDDMVRGCLPLLGGVGDPSRSLFTFNAHGLPRLERAQHVQFLHCSLQGLSAGYVSYDASRPWIVYWVLVGLCLLGEDVGQYRERFLILRPLAVCVSLFSLSLTRALSLSLSVSL